MISILLVVSKHLSFVGDGRGLTGIVEGIGSATSSGPVSYGITALRIVKVVELVLIYR